MKRFAYYIICCSLVALFSCTHDDIDEVLTPVGDSKITIQSTLDEMAITRAAEGEVDDTNPERVITHIDIFAIDANGNIDYYERNTTGNNGGADVDGAGRLTLSVSRRAKDANDNYIFAQDENYKFILVANAAATQEEMAAAATLSDLEKLVQDDSFETSFVGGGSTNDDTTDGETGSGTDSTTGGATEGTPTMSRQTLLHLSGTSQGQNPDKDTPQTFLMDAVVTDADGNKEWEINPASGTVPTLNLSAEFKRAASKIIVNIKQGADVEFRTLLDNESAQYDFYKLPASTFVLPNDSKLVNIQLINTAPMQQNKETFIWKYTDASNDTPRAENNIQIIGYAYSHSWSDVDLTNETSLILNIPMMWNKDNNTDTGYGYTENGIEHPNVGNNGKEEKSPKSWYKVPLSQGKKLERNKCYIVNIEINAVGASTRSTAIELRDIEYVTLDWVDVGINVGDSSDTPEYLTLNTDLVEIYNANFDNTSLKFSSSSAITSVTLKDVYSQNADGTFTAATDSYYAYYINKFGVKTNLSKAIRETISATAEENVLNGGISILSPIVPETEAGGEETHYNTIRYLEFEVKNAEGLTATFRVMQYPVIYVVNIEGYYSYRSDFYHSIGTEAPHWENYVTPYCYNANWASYVLERRRGYGNWTQVETGYGPIYYNGTNYYCSRGQLDNDMEIEYTGNDGYNYRIEYTNEGTVFRAKVVSSVYTSGENRGKSYIGRYIKDTNKWKTEKDRDPGNHRMYHVRVTATSNTYTVGRPRILNDSGEATEDVENGYTDNSLDNSKIVSPSFMIASQLGTTIQELNLNTDQLYERAKDHCKNYVETYKDSDGTVVHLKDWRLPTKAEIDIIAELQKQTDGAVDLVLAGQYYMCASPDKYTDGNPEYNTAGHYIRCVRDKY